MNKYFTFVLFASCAAAAGAAGVYWSDDIRALLNGAGPQLPESIGAQDATQLWTCGMHPQVIQDHPGECPICHMELTPLQVDDGDGAAQESSATGERSAASRERTVKYWWDPMMNPPYISDKPGKSPMGMDLIPVYEDEIPAGGSSVIIDPVIVQNMGVRVENASAGPLRRSIRVVGYLDEAQPNLRDINLRISGWIRRLHAHTEGMLVQEGDPLFDLYSPELTVAVEELITARRGLNALPASADARSREMAQSIFDAAVSKLLLWDIPKAPIDILAKLDQAPESITFTSPITGYVTEKLVVEGAAVMAGDRVLRIVDHSTLWIDAQVFERDLAFVSLGQTVRLAIVSRPGEEREGDIVFIHPSIDETLRTATVRIVVSNEDLSLRPGMYATGRIEAQLAERAILVPREAVIDTGDRQVVFIASGGGRFEPRLVEIGHAADDGMVQIVTGLAPGEPVVVSGQFLLDSESRLREAVRKFLEESRQPLVQVNETMVPDHDMEAHPTDGAVAEPSIAPLEHTLAVDPVLVAYLDIAERLGAPQESDAPVDGADLLSTAHALQEIISGAEGEAPAAAVAGAAETFAGAPLDQQRESFKALSEAVIALVERIPPSTDVAERLYLMHCPMAPGNWLETDEEVSNPYYATQMKRCGEVVRVIELARHDQGEDE